MYNQMYEMESSVIDVTVQPMDSEDVTEDHRKRRSLSPVSGSEGSTATTQEDNGKLGNGVEETDSNEQSDDVPDVEKPSLQEEIEQLARKKKEVVMKGRDKSSWKQELQRRLEQELERRVRDALETPPLERMRRNKHKAKLRKMQQEKVMEEQQRSLTLSECQNYAQNLPTLKLRYPWNDLRSSFQYRDMSDASWWNRKNRSQRNDQEGTNGSGENIYGGVLANGIATNSPTLQTLLDRAYSEGNTDMLEDDQEQVAEIKKRTFHRYTREGFKEALKKGKLKLKKIGNGKFMDRNGVVLTADGPFWPPECGPLYPKPEHISGVPEDKELLSTHVPQETRTVDNQRTKWFRPWEGTQVVYDSERMSKGTVPHTTPEGCSQSLFFESRFESGNLRQARRVGQFEYDLMLKTDLYTNRHTQWFYFRVQHMMPGVTYKFNIINLLKKDSLYNHGMRPLFYSESLAKNKQMGWYREGHHILYGRYYNTSRNPLLHPEISYYSLEWQMEFPSENDTCYLTHCYPYTFTDLCEHIDNLCADSHRKKFIQREVLCESRAGNSCFLLTIGNQNDQAKENKNLPKRKGVIITARVHPGETNSSWMMKGLLDFITSTDPVAKDLRKAFTFKIVPMLNPDGVIVGNYRCSLSGRDLNRNFRHPKKESFPTIYHTKNMLEEFGKDHDVMIYCDLHGHSRKHNIFIYGCDHQDKEMDAATFLCQRLFPWLISRQAPDKFSFRGCKFQVKRCKEATGRVVMWRQMGISNSFTMEATFCGSKNIQQMEAPRHFNIHDFQDMGRHFCEALLQYHKAQENKSLHSEFIFELTKVITHQVLTSRGMMPPNFNLFAKSLLADGGVEGENKENLENDVDGAGDNQDASVEIVNEKDAKSPQGEKAKSGRSKKKEESSHPSNSKSKSNSSKPHKSSKKEKKQQIENRIRSKLEALRFIDSMSSETVQGCVNLIRELHVMSELAESDTSDSDSASESEMTRGDGEEGKEQDSTKQSKQKRKKTRSRKKTITSGGSENEGSKPGKSDKKKYQPFVNRYHNRTNNGIPMFAQERTQERALKRYQALRRAEQERLERETSKFQLAQDDDYAQLLAFTRELQKQQGDEVHQMSAPPLTGTGYTHTGGSFNRGPRLEYLNGIIYNADLNRAVAPSDTPPRKLQPVAGLKYPHGIKKPGVQSYQVGFHVSKVGKNINHGIENILNTDHGHSNAPSRLASIDASDRRRAMSSLGPIFLADLQGNSDAEGSNQIFFDENGEVEDFDIPLPYQELEKMRLLSVEPGIVPIANQNRFDPFEGITLQDGNTGGYTNDVNNNDRAYPNRAHTSFGHTPSSKFFLTSQQRQTTFHQLLNRQSEMVKQRSAPSLTRDGHQNGQKHRGQTSKKIINMQDNKHQSTPTDFANHLAQPIRENGLQGMVAKTSATCTTKKPETGGETEGNRTVKTDTPT